MDSVRFGRALGFGARHAAKALAGAVDAATAPNPRETPHASAAPRTPPPTQAGSRPAHTQSPAAAAVQAAARAAARTHVQARETRKGIARGSKRFGEAAWGPFVKLSGVLWLEVTGAFFGIFALFAGQAAWVRRAEFYSHAANAATHRNAIVLLLMALVFSYFCVSSFVRAHRRQRSR